MQEIGRAGRDGEDAHCHLFLNGDDYVRLRSFAFADAPYKAAIEELVHSVFAGRAHGGKKRKYPGDEASGSLVAIPLQRIEEMDLKKEVAATLLTYIELRRADLLRVMPSGCLAGDGSRLN